MKQALLTRARPTPSTGPTVRIATPDDTRRRAELLTELYEHECPELMPRTRAALVATIARRLGPGTGTDVTYLAELDGRLVGTISVSTTDRPRRPALTTGEAALTLFSGGVAVASAFRRLSAQVRLDRALCRQLPSGHGQLHSLVVTEPARGRGVSRALIAAVENHLRSTGHDACGLYVLRGNEAVVPLYRRLGYTERLLPTPRWAYPAAFFTKSLLSN